MPGSELFTIIALVEARDRASRVITRMDEAFTSLADSAERTAAVVGSAGEEVDAALLASASGVDDLQLGIARLSAARAELTKLTEDQAKAEIDLMAIQDKVNSGELRGAEATDALVLAMRELDKAAAAASMSEGRLAEIQAAQTAAADRAAAANAAAAGAASRSAKASEAGLLGIGRWGKGAMVAGAAAAFLGYETVKTASSFDTLTTRLVTSANESSSNLKMIRNGILEVSAATGTSANELAKSMYTVESAGYHGAAGLTVLKAATEGAQQEGANFADVANGVTDVLVDYHRPASAAADVTSQLVRAVSFGKTNFQMFSQSLSNILPLASSMHLKLADVTGVLAEMTAHGMNARRASFNMANAMRSLEAPTAQMEKEFKAVGITSQDVSNSLSHRGLAGTLQWLSELAHKNAKELGQTYPGALRSLVGTATGLQVALLTTGENAKGTQKAIEGISRASADGKGNVEGYAKTQHNIAYQMDKFKAALVAAGIAIGNALIPALVKVMTVLNKFLIPVVHFIEKHRTMAAIVMGVAVAIGVLAGIIAILNGVFAVMNVILDANPFVLIALAIIAVVAAIIYAYHHWTTFRVIVQATFAAVKEAALIFWHSLVAVWNAVSASVKALWHSLKSTWDAISNGVTNLWHFLVGIWNSIASSAIAIWDSISGFFKKWWPLLFVIFEPFIATLVAIWNHCHTQIEDAAKTVWNFIKGFLSGAWHEIEGLAKTVWALIKIGIIHPVEEVWHFIKSIWDKVKPYLDVIWSGIVQAATSLWNRFKTNVINPIEELWHYISGKFKTIESFVSGAMSGAVNKAISVAKGFWHVGVAIIEGMISGAKSMVGHLMSTIGNIANDALKGAKSFLGIGSPSKKFRDEVGKWIPHGIAQGVLDYAHIATSAVGRVAGSLTGTVPAPSRIGASIGTSLAASNGLVSGGGGGGGGNLILDIHDNHIMNDRDLDSLVDKIGNRIATRILPAGGVRIRM